MQNKLSYKLLILSFLMLNLFGWVLEVEVKYGIPQIVKYILSVSALGIIIWYWLINRSKPMPGGLFYPLIIVFVLWSLIMIFSAIIRFDNLFYLQRVLAQRYFFIPYLLPLMILFSKFDLKFFSYFFKYSFILIIFALIIQLYTIAFGIDQTHWFEQTSLIFIFDIGSIFLLLTAHISRKKYISNIVLVYFIIYIFLWAMYGRRGMLIEYVISLIMMLIIRLRSPFLIRTDRMKIYFTGLLLILLFIAIGYLITSTYAFQRGFSKDAFEESRGLVFDDFFSDFNTAKDWIFGRGLLGLVSRSIYGFESADFIENGILNIVLKGGLIYAILFISILLRATYLGFFRSKNDLVRALASIALIHVIMMLYFNLPDYSTRYILVWISATACFNPRMRNYSNEEVFQAINFRDEASGTNN